MKEIDVGFTHLAFIVRDLDKSIDFYLRYAGMKVIQRHESGVADAHKVVWLMDHIQCESAH